MIRRNTRQKELVRDAVYDMKRHVTANEVYDFIKKKYNVESVSVKYIKDESLIGGFIIMVGDNVYDMSYKNKLKALKERL